jgi:hypothetical protein
MDTTITFGTGTYNPYLEGTLRRGTRSNCLVCHQKAVYFGNGHALDRGVYPPDPPYFDDGIRTDFLWSVADNDDGGAPIDAPTQKQGRRPDRWDEAGRPRVLNPSFYVGVQ